MRRSTVTSPEFQPFSQMNTTPLIDVLLVLLIMFILTIPMQSHKVAIELPSGTPAARALPQTHRLTIAADGALGWDGQPVADTALRGRLDAVVAQPHAVLQIETAAEARYERFDTVLAMVKRAGVTRLGFVGNERHRF